MENEKKPQSAEDQKKPEDTTKKSLQDGFQAIDINKKVDQQSGDTKKVEETEKKDAERWRNEG